MSHEHHEHAHHHGHHEHHQHAHHHHAHAHHHTFALTGVTGNVGGAAAKVLIANGHKVRGIVRDATGKKAEELKALGVELHVAKDLLDVSALAKAFSGVDGVFLMQPPTTGDVDVRAEAVKIAQAFEKAIAESKVKKAVILSSIGAHQPAGTGIILKLHDLEAIFSKHTELEIGFVRAAYFAENTLGSLAAIKNGTFPTFNKVDAPIPIVASVDIGAEVARLLEAHFSGHRYVALEGPERLTPTQLAAICSKVAGKEIKLAPAPEEAILPAISSWGSPDWAKHFAELNIGLNNGTVTYQGNEEVVKGVTSYEAFIKPFLV